VSKEEAILRYKASLSVFKNWAASGLISREELLTIDTMIAKKYGLSLSSIYRENDLINSPNRVIYSGTEGEAHGKNRKQN
jgi:hypothetical protein